MTQSELARRMGAPVKQLYISKWEEDRDAIAWTPKPQQIIMLAKALNVLVSELTGDIEDDEGVTSEMLAGA